MCVTAGGKRGLDGLAQRAAFVRETHSERGKVLKAAWGSRRGCCYGVSALLEAPGCVGICPGSDGDPGRKTLPGDLGVPPQGFTLEERRPKLH